ncbi:TmcC family electron transfer complex membrane anchor subunit [Thermodesulfovibrio thiophilus]|uniref:TmcC family electron transfer complex membrane anchor subunit n=1 Tax=Thermodesulfovibrio thiophilus TaxID=340095 RepID=UPI00178F8B5B|nr:nitrate reductase [Thermodesulfovibrio thiophilus]HHW20289.1 nitrate reductase [Thermodesulfovibrio thiophilus]
MEQFLNDPSIYTLARGPLVWLAFIVFFTGMFYKITSMLKMAKSERVIYPYLSLKYTLRSLIHWLTPYGSISMRKHPWFTSITFIFHICVIVTPIFLAGHIELWHESWGVSWCELPVSVADSMTMVVISCIIILIVRRIFQSDVRFLSSSGDYIALTVVLMTFLTGFLAHNELLLEPRVMLTIHFITGEIMLMSIPFTRLSHMFFFWLTRAHTGSEFGAVRHSKDY